MKPFAEVKDGVKNIGYILPFVISWYDDYFLHDNRKGQGTNLQQSAKIAMLNCSQGARLKLSLFQHRTGIYFRQLLLGMLGKIAPHHPVIVLRFSL